MTGRKQITRVIEPTIHIIRGPGVMLDSDLAAIYGTTTMRLNEQFRRNRKRTKLAQLERRLDSHDEAIAQLFAAIRELLQPPTPATKREIGFHVREAERRYRIERKRAA